MRKEAVSVGREMSEKKKRDPPYQLRPRRPRQANGAAQQPVNPAEARLRSRNGALKERNYEGLKLNYWSKLATPRLLRYRTKIDDQKLTGAFRIIIRGTEMLHLYYSGDPTQIAKEDRGNYPCDHEFEPRTRVLCDAGFTCGTVGQAPNHEEMGSVTFENKSIRLFVMLKNRTDPPAHAEGVASTSRVTGPTPLEAVELESDDGTDEEAPEEEEVPPVIPGSSDDTILVEETPETSRNDDGITRCNVIIPETPDDSIDETLSQPGDDFPSYASSSMGVDKETEVENQATKTTSKEAVTLTKRDEKRAKEPFIEDHEKNILLGFQPRLPRFLHTASGVVWRGDIPLQDERPQLEPIAVGTFYPPPNPKACDPESTDKCTIIGMKTLDRPVKIVRPDAVMSDQSISMNASRASLASTIVSGKDKRIRYLPSIIEELKKAGQKSLADQLAIIEAESYKHRLDESRNTTVDDEALNAYPTIAKYVQTLKLIGTALRISQTRDFPVPELSDLLSTEATNRIFKKLMVLWDQREKAGNVKTIRRNVRKGLTEIYPGGDIDCYLQTGNPYKDPMDKKKNKKAKSQKKIN